MVLNSLVMEILFCLLVYWASANPSIGNPTTDNSGSCWVGGIMADMALFKADLVELRVQNDRLVKETANLKFEKNSLETIVEGLDLRIRNVTLDNAQLIYQSTDLRRETDNLRSETSNLKDISRNLTLENTKLTTVNELQNEELKQLKEELQEIKKMLKHHQKEEEDLRNEYHDTKMFVLKKVQACEEKLTWALGGGERLPTAQEALALKKLRYGGDLRPLSDITSSLNSLSVYDSCQEAYDQGPKIPGLYKIRVNSTIKDINCSMANGTMEIAPQRASTYNDCMDAYAHGQRGSGIYNIRLSDNSVKAVWCDQELDGGGWTVFQQRIDGTTDFYRNWDEYRNGFGDLRTNFWLGNNALHLLTVGHNQKLKIELRTTRGELGYANYSSFWVENEASKYELHVGGFTGTGGAGDSLSYHSGMKFSTRDADNDINSSPCARSYHGAWWYKACHYSNLNGLYGETKNNLKGLAWHHWPTYTNNAGIRFASSTRMMIRTNE